MKWKKLNEEETLLVLLHNEWESPHHDPELWEADLAVTIPVHGGDHLRYLLVGDLPGQELQDKLHLLCRNTAWGDNLLSLSKDLIKFLTFLILTEDPESVLEKCLWISFLALLPQQETKVLAVQSSILLIMSCTSDSVGFWPALLMADCSSWE